MPFTDVLKFQLAFARLVHQAVTRWTLAEKELYLSVSGRLIHSVA